MTPVRGTASASAAGTPDDIPDLASKADTGTGLKPYLRFHEALGALARRFSLLPRSRPRPRRRLLFTFVIVVALALGLGLGLGLRARHERVDTSGPIVRLSYASYRGSHLGNNISQFLGLRFAEPPLGPLRWRAPVPPESLDGHDIQQAKEFAPICLGISETASRFQDEDCLYANVWAPTNATADMKLPVMVFIQGGGYTRNANANWNGTRLVDTSGNGIVFVNFNYRVGLWGFLAGEAVYRDGHLNAGLLDQRRLLQWVQEHIHNVPAPLPPSPFTFLSIH